MNKDIIKVVGAFAAGLGIGGFIGYYISKKKYEDELTDLYNEVEALDKAYDAFNDKVHALVDEYNLPVTYDDLVDDKVEEDPNVEERAIDISTGSYTERMNQMKEEYTRYGAITKSYQGDDEELEANDLKDQVDEVSLAVNNDAPVNDIYVINADQFAREKFGYDKVTLYFWGLERLLTDEDGDILDVPDLLGYDWESHIGEFEPDIVYVRNDLLESDYEVVLRHDSFYEMRDGV